MSGKKGSSGQSGGKPPPKPPADRANAKGNGPKKMTVRRVEGVARNHEVAAGAQNSEVQEYGSYFTRFVCRAASSTYKVQEVFLSRVADFAGFAVLDTACQRSVCSLGWLQSHEKLMKKFGLEPKTWPEKEGFQFGVGNVQFSSEHAYPPACLDHNVDTCCLEGRGFHQLLVVVRNWLWQCIYGR